MVKGLVHIGLFVLHQAESAGFYFLFLVGDKSQSQFSITRAFHLHHSEDQYEEDALLFSPSPSSITFVTLRPMPILRSDKPN